LFAVFTAGTTTASKDLQESFGHTHLGLAESLAAGSKKEPLTGCPKFKVEAILELVGLERQP